MSTPTHLPTEDKLGGAQHVDHPDENEAGYQSKFEARKAKINNLDQAAKLLDQVGEIDYSAEDEKRVLRKIDLYVCLPMCIIYLCQQLDKGAVSSAAVFNLQIETNLVGTEYSWLTSCLYLAELICQPLSSFALIYFPVKYWVMFNFISWSAVTMGMAASKDFLGLVISRRESSSIGIHTILPSFVFITQMWWTRREGTSRTTAYQIANSMASVFGPLMSYGIGHATSGSIKAYQGIFLFIGGFSMAMVLPCWYLMPNSPVTAKFLSGGNDRLIALQRLKANNVGTKTSKWKWNQAKEVFMDSKTYLWALMYFLTATPSGGFGSFGGLITKGFGFDSFQSILMQMPIGAIQILGLLLSTWLINKYRIRWIVIACLTIPPIGSAIGLIKAPRNLPAVLLICYYIALSFGVIQPQLFSWANQNAAGSTKRVVLTATMFSFQCAGNVVGPQVYFTREAPYYQTGLYVDIACWVALACVITLQAWNLRRLNRRQVERRRALGLPADIKDMSIMPASEARAYKEELNEMMKSQGLDASKFNAESFDDLTDFENPSFMYVL